MSRYYLTQEQTCEIIGASAYGDAEHKQMAKAYVNAYFSGNANTKPYAKARGKMPRFTLCVESAIKPDIEICRLMPTFVIEYLSQHGAQPNTPPDSLEAR